MIIMGSEKYTLFAFQQECLNLEAENPKNIYS